ncbi:MAG: long-chain fatty acid transporter [Rikenellaceae bacterium]
MKKILFVLSLFVALCVGANAQNYTGLLANMDGLTVGEMANLSQTDFQYGTARSMAMSGALSSLGADATTMGTNPAGLGLYQRSEFTFTPLVTSQKSNNSAMNYQDNTKTTFSIANAALVSTITSNSYSSGLISLSVGVGYSRLVDLNYNTSFFQSSLGKGSSIGQYFSDQLRAGGVSLSQIQDSGNDIWYDSNINTDIWGAVLGYKVGLADWNDDDGWNPGWIGDNADVGHFVTMQSRGSVGEYNVSMGANISNKIYIGASMGIVNLHQELNVSYSEDYIYPDGESTMGDYQLNYSNYNQTVIMNGLGVNFKFGLIYRPVESFKLAFAVHTPTSISIDREYQAAASSSVRINTSTPDDGIYPDSNGNAYFEEYTPIIQDYNEECWSYNTPTRIIVGASYIIGNRALLSVDYEHDWYNGIRMTSAPTGINLYDYENQANIYLNGSNSLRIGGEFRVTPAVALRIGYGFTNSITSSDNDVAYSPSSPVVESTNFFSAGVGFAVSKTFNIDLAYMNHTTHYSDFQLFGILGGDLYSLNIVRHNFAVTTSFKW